jgi:transposase InsO family protein
VSDITYLRTPGNWLYLTSVTDLFDRKVIDWPFSTHMTAERTAVSAPVTARVNRRPKDGLVFHSGRGARYRAASFREKLRELCPTVRQSMSRKGNCRDNACAESFFKTLKRELDTPGGQRTASGVRDSVFEYTGSCCNRKRLHSESVLHHGKILP